MTRITLEQIAHLYEIEKICPESPSWLLKNTGHWVFQTHVVTVEEEVLMWYGYVKRKFDMVRHGFNLVYRRKYVVRSWDMGKKHWSKTEQRYIRGIGCHKHYYLDSYTPREVCEIPRGEISITDPNKATLDFAKECNITLLKPYQAALFI